MALLAVSREVPHLVVPLVEMESPLLFSLVTLASTLPKKVLPDISKSVVPLRPSESLWAMMAELKDLPMLNSKTPKVPPRVLLLMVSLVTEESLGSTFPPHQAAVAVIEVAEVASVEEVASAEAIEVASVEEVASEEAIEAASVEEAASEEVIEVASEEEAASVDQEDQDQSDFELAHNAPN